MAHAAVIHGEFPQCGNEMEEEIDNSVTILPYNTGGLMEVKVRPNHASLAPWLPATWYAEVFPLAHSILDATATKSHVLHPNITHLWMLATKA